MESVPIQSLQIESHKLTEPLLNEKAGDTEDSRYEKESRTRGKDGKKALEAEDSEKVLATDEGAEAPLSVHMKLFKWCNYGINKIHNPFVTGVALVVVASCVHFSQLSAVISNNSYLNYLEATPYMYDILSNLLNMIFLLRFTVNVKFIVDFEVGLLVAQIVGIVYLTYLNTAAASLSVTSILFYLQILCPVVINGINFMDCLSHQLDFGRFLVNTNNNFLPVLLTSSFSLINVDFKLYTNTRVLLAYKVLVISLKLYCLYQYILFELFNNFTNQFVSFNRRFEFKNYVLLAAIGVLVGYDMVYVYMIHMFNL